MDGLECLERGRMADALRFRSPGVVAFGLFPGRG